ncbi:hypothetical protein TNIN_226781 [Trichonephila inaurata madagascariensis]|uniref:Uncharacterized protein n=1 Tax=Trichonephila inaurata madagascariensis TaxID=2747483 RepID=A0A8X7CCY1_9ARAC|nr:hypothetical protein TNIN_226781 [Trichonephila inaurata madagascariensis]
MKPIRYLNPRIVSCHVHSVYVHTFPKYFLVLLWPALHRWNLSLILHPLEYNNSTTTPHSSNAHTKFVFKGAVAKDVFPIHTFNGQGFREYFRKDGPDYRTKQSPDTFVRQGFAASIQSIMSARVRYLLFSSAARLWNFHESLLVPAFRIAAQIGRQVKVT